VTCAVDPATTEDVDVVSVQPDVPDGVPIPIPTAVDADGLSDVSVAATLPVCATMNVKTTAPPWANVPEKVSVDVAVDVDGDVESLFRRLHAAAIAAAHINASAYDDLRRVALIMLPKDQRRSSSRRASRLKLSL
jgi:hypothetical protein